MCKSPCPECPYQKTAMPGYFGPNDGLIYRRAINQEAIVPCHTRTKHDKKGDPVRISPCTGLVISMIKSCRSPINPELKAIETALRARSDIEALKSSAIPSWEFSTFHKLDESRTFEL